MGIVGAFFRLNLWMPSPQLHKRLPFIGGAFSVSVISRIRPPARSSLPCRSGGCSGRRPSLNRIDLTAIYIHDRCILI